LELIAISDIYADTTQTRALLNKLGKQECDERIIVVAGDIGIKTAPKTKTEKVLKMLSTACSPSTSSNSRTTIFETQDP